MTVSIAALTRRTPWAAALAGALGLASLFIANAARAADFGPQVGAAIPAGFTAPDHTGADQAFADLAGESGLVLFVVRSADWCPVCKAQLREIDTRSGELTTAGYNVAALTTDSVEALADYAARRSPGFTLLSDADSAVIRAWDLLDPAFPEGHRAHGLPYPATFVIGADGVVRAKLYAEDQYGEGGGYRERVTFDDVAAAAVAARHEG